VAPLSVIIAEECKELGEETTHGWLTILAMTCAQSLSFNILDEFRDLADPTSFYAKTTIWSAHACGEH